MYHYITDIYQILHDFLICTDLQLLSFVFPLNGNSRLNMRFEMSPVNTQMVRSIDINVKMDCHQKISSLSSLSLRSQLWSGPFYFFNFFFPRVFNGLLLAVMNYIDLL